LPEALAIIPGQQPESPVSQAASQSIGYRQSDADGRRKANLLAAKSPLQEKRFSADSDC
jgi:hypothetical protein